MNCWHCHRRIEVKERVGFRDYCPQCDRPLHACRNCRFYDPAYHNQCRETQAELVSDKERFNFCDFFSPSEDSTKGERPENTARAKLDELFRKK